MLRFGEMVHYNVRFTKQFFVLQIAQSHAASGAMTSAAAAVAQLAANGGKLNPHGDQISNQVAITGRQLVLFAF